MKDLPAFVQRFILHWGEMGTRWGINRSLAQMHALLMVSAEPLTAEQIADTLGIARSNVSTGLKELQGWGIVRKVHLPGDRRDHYASRDDVWEMFRQIAVERKRREVDPTLSVLRECVAQAGSEARHAHPRRRIAELLGLFDLAVVWFEEVSRMPTPTLVKLFKLGGRLSRTLDRVRAEKRS